MGSVAIRIRVMPDSSDADLAAIKKHISKKFKPEQMQEKPIGFGLKSLEILIIRPDAGGGTDDIEEELARIEGVSGVEVEDVTLI